jgi:hypothetical protein
MRLPRYVILPSLLTILVASPVTHADEKAACLEAHVQGQKLRHQGRLLEASAQFAECSRSACPGVVQGECAQWHTEVETRTPSVAVQARDTQGQDTVDVAVAVDGKRIRDRLDGLSIPLDPGEHALSFTAGGETIDLHVLVVEGDKDRKLVVDFSTLHPSSAPPPAPSRPFPPAPPLERPIPALTFVFGGIALAALASFTTFAILGKTQENYLDGGCAQACTDRDWQVMHQRYIAADVSLAVAALSVGVGTWIFLARPARPKVSGWLSVAPQGGGVVAGAGTSF